VKIVFLFGAGASYGSVDCSPKCPPLGNCLFEELRIKGGIAATVDEEHRQLFKDFEEGMARFRATRPPAEVTAMLREMSEYFAPFTPGANNLYRRLINTLSQWQRAFEERRRPRVVLATTNYDLLIECAILDSGCAVVYPTPDGDADRAYANLPLGRGLARYWAPRTRYGVEHELAYLDSSQRESRIRYQAFEAPKVHGSCNFLPDIPPTMFRNTTLAGGIANYVGPIRSVLPADKVLDYLGQADSIAPAIALYEQGKQVLYAPDYVQEHQTRFQAAVQEADKIFLIGIKVWPQDRHIWDHVASSSSWLGYVGFDHEEFSSWCEEKGRSNYHFLEETFEDALPRIEQELDAVTP
jgi:hypothetical protein